VWYTQIEKIKQYPYDMGKVCPLNDGTSNLMLTTRRSQFICVINLSKSNMIYKSKTKLMQHNVFFSPDTISFISVSQQKKPSTHRRPKPKNMIK